MQPVLSARCANPSCHGDERRPFEVFAVHQHRLDPRNVYRDAPLTEHEVRLNYLRACGFLSDFDTPAETLLLLKPLAGEVTHRGGKPFADETDAGYRALADWCEGAQ